jgi:hypothetical protein
LADTLRSQCLPTSRLRGVTLPSDQTTPITDAHLRAAGFALAHALGSLDADPGGTLCTLAYVERDKAANLFRYEAESIQESVALARRDLPARLGAGGCAALVYDGYVTQERVRRDALIVELIDSSGKVLTRLTQAYRPARLRALGLLRALGMPLPGRIEIIGPPTTEASLPAGASAALTDGLATHPFGRRIYRLPRPTTR